MLGFGLTVSAIGMVIVFAELILLIAIIQFISAAANKLEGGKKKAIINANHTSQLQAAAVQPAESAGMSDDNEVMAVIAAAIHVMSGGALKIKAVRCRSSLPVSSWSMAGRQETMALRQF